MVEKSETKPPAPEHDDPASLAKQRARYQSTIRHAPFAGRIGGNQEFVALGDDAESEALLKKQPDAAPIFSIKDSLDPRGFLVLDTYRQAVIEGLGTCLLVFCLGATSTGLTEAGQLYGQSLFSVTLYAALVNVIGLSLFIYAAAPASGGHLNPAITFATLFAGLCTLPRAVLYVTAQATGAIIGSYWLRLGVGEENFFPTGTIPGCTADPSKISAGQHFVLEWMFSQALIFIAFGVGLDPRQGKIFGPAYAPLLVGTTLGFGTLASGQDAVGYSGLGFNCARCLGLMTAKQNWQNHWIQWLGPFTAAAINGFFYHFFPPYVRNKPMSVHNPTHLPA